jgi:hypothetical protein
MATIGGANIVRNGLVLELDAASRNSYPGTGTVWNDLSGNNNNGTLVNGPTFSSANGGSLLFNGTNQNVFSNVGTTLNIGTTISVTLSCWIRYTVSAADYTGLISKALSTGGSNTGFQMLLYANKLSCELAASGVFIGPIGPGTIIGRTILNTGQWFNTVLTINRNTNTVSAYVNGVLESSVTNASVSANNLTSASNLLIGVERTSGLFLNGNIASAQIYTVALTALEIQQNYNATKSRFDL